ncbi:hypothetical protein BH10PSE9_BH10PSE9_04050 [soil metagenome]
MFKPSPPRSLRPTLSVLVAVHERGGVTATCLEALRPYADEIVVAFDSRMPPDEVGPLQSIADTLIGFEFSGRNRFRPWLREQAHCDWLLLLDGDEIPSAELLARLPALISNRHVGGYTIPCWWVWPDPTRRLVSSPYNDDHVRLVRNDSHLSFPGLPHTGAECDPPARFADAPFIHLDLLLNSVDVRSRKVANYTNQDYPLFAHDGRQINEAFYLPEHDTEVRTEPIPAGDCERIERALARRDDRRPLSRRVQTASAAEVERWWSGRPADAFGHRGEIKLLAGDARVIADNWGQFLVEVANLGDTVWPAHAHSPPGRYVALSYHWKRPEGSVAVWDGQRTTFPHRIAPQERVQAYVDLRTPDVAGRYRLVLDLVHEGVRWFGIDRKIEVEVDPSISEQFRAGSSAGLFPLAGARSLRRRLRQPNALANPAPGDTAPGSRMDQACLEYLLALIERQKCARVLEFGSGDSTVSIAGVLAKRKGRILSIDQEAAYAERTSTRLAESGLAGDARVLVLGLAETSAGGIPTRCYDFSAEAIADIRSFAPDLVVIDGPSLMAGASRLAIAPTLSGLMDRPVPFVMHDALRDAELDIGDRWQRQPGVQIQGIVAVGMGLLVGRFTGKATGQDGDRPA